MNFDKHFWSKPDDYLCAIILDANGKIYPTQLPSIAITDTFVVNNESEMLNLTTAEQGDIAVRTDISKTFILTTSDYSNISDWVELKAPTDLPDLISPDTVGSGSNIPVITYDSKGRITGVTSSSISIPDGIILQNGNSFGTTMSIGTNDNQPLVFKTNNVNRIIIGATSGIITNIIDGFTINNKPFS